MKLTPVAGPGQIPPNGTPEAVRTAKAISAFNNASKTSQPVNHAVDQNNISAEEVSAVRASSRESEIDKDATLEASEETTDPQVEETTEEVAPKVEEPKKDPALSRQFAQLARQEKALRLKAQQQDQAIKAREQAIVARERALEQQGSEYKTGYLDKNRLKADPLGALSEVGISYDDLVAQIMNPIKTDPRVQSTIDELKAQIQELKSANDNNQKTFQDKQTADYNAAVKQIEADAKKLVYTDPYFETIKTMGRVKDVVELITETYAKDQVLLSVEDAAKEVEDYLVDSTVKQISRVEKIKKQLNLGSTPKVAAKTQTPTSPKQPQMKTLTNASSVQRQLSARERALLAFRGELK